MDDPNRGRAGIFYDALFWQRLEEFEVIPFKAAVCPARKGPLLARPPGVGGLARIEPDDIIVAVAADHPWIE